MSIKKNSKSRIFAILLPIGLIILIAIAGCVSNKENKEKGVYININVTPITPITPKQEFIVTPIPQATSEDGISSGTSGMMERYNLDKLVSMSDSVVIAEVIFISPSRWNTQNGEKPTVNDGIPHTIYTDANIKILEYLKGSLSNTADNTTITVRMLGGTVGQDKQYVEDQPLYNANEKVLIFLKNDNDPRTKDIGKKHMITTGLMQGKISISKNNDVIIGDEKLSLDMIRVRITGK